MAADPLVGKVLADRFEILERIGEGGTGVVYKAKQLTVDRDIAIKVLGAHVSSDPEWVKRFHNEARAAAKLHHANTVQLIDFGQTKEGLLFIAMELLHGRSLRDELDAVGRLPPERALPIIIQGCGSVGEAHSLGIIHRDIKPDNLYLVDMAGASDFVKVLDFSVAKMDGANSQQTRAGIVFGTPSYMSPEQGRGAKLGPQSDVYAFGIVLYEMLNGKPPFDSKIPTEVVMMHLRDKPQPIAGIPDSINALLQRTLEKDPAKRQPTCQVLAQECEAVLLGLSGGARVAGRPLSGPMAVVPSGPISVSPSGGHGAGGYASGGAAAGYGASQGAAAGYGAGPAAGPSYAQPAAAPGGEARTMIAEAPGPRPAAGGGNATMLLDAPSLAPNRPGGGPSAAGGGQPQGTMMLPDSQGVVAFALAQAEAARAAAASEQQPRSKPTPWTFWAAWVVLGIGMGLAMHFFLLHRQLG